MAPGEVRQISTGITVTETTTTSTGQPLVLTITLPPVTVAAEHIISLTPPTQTVDSNATADYTVALTNPLPTDETYDLSVDGLAGFTIGLTGQRPGACRPDGRCAVAGDRPRRRRRGHPGL